MRVTWISFVLLALTARAPAQLNQYDAQHKKHGPWLVYLNSWWKEVSDSTRATYRKYTWYDHGENLYPMGPRDKHWKLVHKDSSDADSSRIRLLNGAYTWIDKKGVTRGIDVFRKGQYVLYKWFYPSGKLNQVFDYTKKWKGQEHTWLASEYDRQGRVKHFAMRKGPQGWLFYPTSSEEKVWLEK